VEEKKKLKMPRTFMSKAYIQELEKGLFGLYRNIEMEEPDPKTGKPVREKIKAIGPIKLLREAQKGEEKRVVLVTVHPVELRELALVEVE
jgi:hypothetical protein